MESELPEDDTAHVPFGTVLASIAGLWLTYFLLTTLRWEMLRWELPGIGMSQELLWPRALVSASGVVITLGLWLVLRLFDSRPLWAKIVAALILSLPVAIASAQANQLIMKAPAERLAEQISSEERRGGSGDVLNDLPGLNLPGRGSGPIAEGKAAIATPWQELTELVFGRYFMMLAWCALYLALLTGEKARAAERREGAFRRAAKAAELRSLRYQVNPHFLFNTLNSLSALVLTGKTQAAEKVIQTLSTFYRRSLADDPTADVPLREEFALQRLYLDIEAIRFPSRLRACYELPAELEQAKVPGMILQPLVENSVKHAVAPSADPVTITLSAREEYGRLVVSVSDDGRADRGGEPRPGYGIGLANVRERLAARFGKEATIVSGPAPGGGYSTLLRMPIVRKADELPL